jgi:hypothetical protein
MSDQPDTPEPEPTDTPPSRGVLLPLLAVGLLAAAGGGGAYWYFVLREKPVVVVPDVGGAVKRDAIPVPEVKFTDVTASAGIKFKHENGLSGKKLLPETMGGGVAVLDFDRDGRQDILFVNSCPWPGHTGRDRTATPHLYRNKGDGTFEDVTEQVGLNVPLYGVGVAVGDFDNDGFPDVFISCVGKHHLFRNVGGKKFEDVTDRAGVGGPGAMPGGSWDDFLARLEPIPFGSSATFLDYDGDGKLDLFVCHYVTWSPKLDLNISSTLRGGSRTFVQPKEFDGGQCALYRNKGDGTFEDVSEKAGVRVTQADGTGPNARKRPVAKSLGVVVCDPDEDGWPDIAVANDTVRNFFFHNVEAPDGTRIFVEEGERAAIAYADGGTPRGGMGIDWGEYLPGKFALVIANFANEPNTFMSMSQPKRLLFSDAALSVGLAGPSRSPLKFGAVFLDFDLDGRLDLLTCNGHIDPDIGAIQGGQTFEQPPQLFWNTGERDRLFEPGTPEKNGPDLFKPLVGRGCAVLDYNGDGAPDVVLVANGGPARLLRNDTKLGHKYIRLSLEGDGKRSNRSAIGAEVTVEAGGKTYRRSVAGARGYLSQSELPVTVGLGTTATVDKVTVRWPGKDAGPPQVWTNLAAGKTYELKQGEAAAKPLP